MKKYHACLTFVLSLFMSPVIGQNVAINTDGSLPNNTAILDIKSDNKGILIPRVTTDARLSMAVTRGLLVYDISTNSFWYFNGAAWQNMATTSTVWSINGNSGTDSTNFIGTTDRPLFIKVANEVSGRIDPDKFNASWGYKTNTNGKLNTAMGSSALYTNTTGMQNAAIGSFSLYANTTGSGNTAIGHVSLSDNTTGSSNTATGASALYHNRTGDYNVANGSAALNDNLSGNENTACGGNSLGDNTSGSYNSAIGALSLSRNTNGAMNTGLGYQTLWGNLTGSNNTAIGSLANVSSDGLTNATAIGFAAFVNASNKVRIGNASVTVIEGQVPFTTPSDGRFKFNIQDDVKGLDFITQLRPVTYQFDVKRFDAQQAHADAATDNNIQWAGYNEASLIRRSGFIAQEVEKAAMASGYNFSGIIKPKTPQEHYSLSYESFVVPLVKAVQELSKQVIDLQNQLNALKQSQP